MASSKPTDDNTTSSKILPDEDVDELILQWLQKRKLTDTLDVLRLELESRGETGSSARSSKRSKHFASLDADLLENGLLVSISNPEGSASAYATQFRQLSTWIVNSLDEYKEQLNQLLYPTFVYAYVTMIQLEADTAAQELLAESKDLFLNQTSNSARREVLLKEIHEFSKIKTPEDFDSFENDVLGQKVRRRIRSGDWVGIGWVGSVRVSRTVASHALTPVATLPTTPGGGDVVEVYVRAVDAVLEAGEACVDEQPVKSVVPDRGGAGL